MPVLEVMSVYSSSTDCQRICSHRHAHIYVPRDYSIVAYHRLADLQFSLVTNVTLSSHSKQSPEGDENAGVRVRAFVPFLFEIINSQLHCLLPVACCLYSCFPLNAPTCLFQVCSCQIKFHSTYDVFVPLRFLLLLGPLKLSCMSPSSYHPQSSRFRHPSLKR